MQRHALEPVAHGVAERGQQEQDREAHEELGQARDGRVGHAAEQAGERAERHSDQQREERRADADLERRLPALEQPDELVAPELAVRAEDEERRLVRRKRLRRARRVAHVRPRADRPQRLAVRERERLVRPVPERVRDQRLADEAEQDEQRGRRSGSPSANLSRLKRRQKSVHCPGGLTRGSDSTAASAATHVIRASALVISAASACSGLSVFAQPARALVAPARGELRKRLYGVRTCTSVTRQSRRLLAFASL